MLIYKSIMNNNEKPLILSIDDDPVVLNVIQRMLTKKGYRISTTTSGKKAFRYLIKKKPDLILVDIKMPEMSGFEVCSRLQENNALAFIPVIFVTALNSEQDKAQAFSYGAVDFISKPFDEDELIMKIQTHLETKDRWKNIGDNEISREKRMNDFVLFKDTLFNTLNLCPELKSRFSRLPATKIYSLCSDLQMPSAAMAKQLAKFLGLHYTGTIHTDKIKLGVLPTSFCIRNLVVAVDNNDASNTFVVSNPFNETVLEGIKGLFQEKDKCRFIVTEPENIITLFQ